MKRKWKGNLYYIDLFCGPGRSVSRETGEEVDGSPLIALKFKFAGYFFVDIEESNIKSLRQRCKSRINFDRVRFIWEDCNQAIESIRKLIPENSLSVALIDPFGLDFDFSSYVKLTEKRRIDLIINFPLGTAIKRNWKKSTSDKSKLDKFLGGTDWRPIEKKPAVHFVEYFKKKLEEIGYKIPWESPLGDIIIKTKKKKVPLYHLLFASKHPLGNKFWKKIRKYDPLGQRSLF